MFRSKKYSLMLTTFWPKTALDSNAQPLLKKVGTRIAGAAAIVFALTLLPYLVAVATKQLPAQAISTILKALVNAEIFLSENYVLVGLFAGMAFLFVIVQLRSIALLTSLAQQDQIAPEEARNSFKIFLACKTAFDVFVKSVLASYTAIVVLGVLKLFLGVLPSGEVTVLHVGLTFFGGLALMSPMLLTAFLPKQLLGPTLLEKITDGDVLAAVTGTFGISIWSDKSPGFTDYPYILTYLVCKKAGILKEMREALGVPSPDTKT